MGFRRGVSSSPEADNAGIDEELSRLITEVTNEINWHMRDGGLTRADLASRMGVSPGRISQVLSGALAGLVQDALSSGVITQAVFGASVIVVVATTVVTPPLLRYALRYAASAQHVVALASDVA